MNKSLFFYIVLGLILVGCDSTDLADTSARAKIGSSSDATVAPVLPGTTQFAEALRGLDASLVRGSLDEVFLIMSDSYDGFGGIYEAEDGSLVIVSKQPEVARTNDRSIVAAAFDLTNTRGRQRDILSQKEITVESANFSFSELAVYKSMIVREFLHEGDIVFLDVDERLNVVRVGIDESVNMTDAVARKKFERLGIPSSAVEVEFMPMPISTVDYRSAVESESSSSVLTLSSYVRPLAGGIKIDKNGGCTLGVPVWYGNPGSQVRGFLTASHCTSFIGYNNMSQWGQPFQSSQPIGVEHEDPSLTNCKPTTSWLCVTDTALIDLNSTNDNSTNTLVAGVYRTDYASSGSVGGYNITGNPVMLSPKSPFVGSDVNKVGVRTGWTTGDILNSCVDILVSMRHADGVFRATWVPCSIRADAQVNSGDSGSSLFEILHDPEPQDDGSFWGILSACTGCNPNVTSQTGDGFWVSWASINAAMNNYITFYEDEGGL